jgi:hypothetical protein
VFLTWSSYSCHFSSVCYWERTWGTNTDVSKDQIYLQFISWWVVAAQNQIARSIQPCNLPSTLMSWVLAQNQVPASWWWSRAYTKLCSKYYLVLAYYLVLGFAALWMMMSVTASLALESERDIAWLNERQRESFWVFNIWCKIWRAWL